METISTCETNRPNKPQPPRTFAPGASCVEAPFGPRRNALGEGLFEVRGTRSWSGKEAAGPRGPKKPMRARRSLLPCLHIRARPWEPRVRPRRPGRPREGARKPRGCRDAHRDAGTATRRSSAAPDGAQPRGGESRPPGLPLPPRSVSPAAPPGCCLTGAGRCRAPAAGRGRPKPHVPPARVPASPPAVRLTACSGMNAGTLCSSFREVLCEVK